MGFGYFQPHEHIHADGTVIKQYEYDHQPPAYWAIRMAGNGAVRVWGDVSLPKLHHNTQGWAVQSHAQIPQDRYRNIAHRSTNPVYVHLAAERDAPLRWDEPPPLRPPSYATGAGQGAAADFLHTKKQDYDYTGKKGVDWIDTLTDYGVRGYFYPERPSADGMRKPKLVSGDVMQLSVRGPSGREDDTLLRCGRRGRRGAYWVEVQPIIPTDPLWPGQMEVGLDGMVTGGRRRRDQVGEHGLHVRCLKEGVRKNRGPKSALRNGDVHGVYIYPQPRREDPALLRLFATASAVPGLAAAAAALPAPLAALRNAERRRDDEAEQVRRLEHEASATAAEAAAARQRWEAAAESAAAAERHFNRALFVAARLLADGVSEHDLDALCRASTLGEAGCNHEVVLATFGADGEPIGKAADLLRQVAEHGGELKDARAQLSLVLNPIIVAELRAKDAAGKTDEEEEEKEEDDEQRPAFPWADELQRQRAAEREELAAREGTGGRAAGSRMLVRVMPRPADEGRHVVGPTPAQRRLMAGGVDPHADAGRVVPTAMQPDAAD